MTTRRSKRGNSRPRREAETTEQMLDRVLDAFDRWLPERGPDEPNDASDAVRTACELKASVLGQPNPADWDPLLATEVLGGIFPRKVLGVDEPYIRAIVPGMLSFIDFLTVTGRWKAHNDADATRTAVAALEPEMGERFADSDRLSMGGRVVQLALDENVDVSDPEALSGFIQRFNEMPLEWRKRLTDGPETVAGPAGADPPGGDEHWDDLPADPFDDPQMIHDLQEATLSAAMAVGFTGETVVITVPDASSELNALRATQLVTRIAALAEWIRPGRKVTTTGAMRRADTAEWLRRTGIGTAESAPNSMWDVPELAIPWSAAAHLGLIDIGATKAFPGPHVDVFSAGSSSDQIRCGRDSIRVVLDNLMHSGDEYAELDRALSGLVLPVIACLCRPGGADLAPLQALVERPFTNSASDALSMILSSLTLTIVESLAEWGVVSVTGTTTAVPTDLRPAVAGAIHGPGSPFTFRLSPGAVSIDP